MIFSRGSRINMVLHENSLSTFFEDKFQQNFQRVCKNLKIYLSDPNDEKIVHDVRTSLRRLNTFYSLLSKKLRKLNRNKIEKYKDFFRASSKIRDLDIIRKKVAAVARDAEDASKLDLQLQKKRQIELMQAIKLAKSLEKMTSLAFKGTSSYKIETRADKVIDRLGVKVEELLPLILSDPSKKEELHSLRKNYKKLRYTLEVLPESHIKKYNRKIDRITGRKDLKEIQDKLGSIRDSDITIGYLRNKRSGFAKQLLVKEGATRDRLYQEFAKYIKE